MQPASNKCIPQPLAKTVTACRVLRRTPTRRRVSGAKPSNGCHWCMWRARTQYSRRRAHSTTPSLECRYSVRP
eukprot:4541950-Alexandrium_andersonii.AAC.1